MKPTKVFAIITAAGQSRRMGGTDKLLLSVGGRPLLVRTVETFLSWPNLHSLVISVTPGREGELRQLLVETLGPAENFHVIAGGGERQDSIRLALEFLQGHEEPSAMDPVLIHDGARPFVDHGLFDALLSALPSYDGVLPATPVRDTIKRVRGSQVERTEDRDTLRQVQTPQVFPFGLIHALHERAREERFLGTDDASLVERYGGTVGWVEGPAHNLKVTVPEDIALLEELARRANQSRGAATRP